MQTKLIFFDKIEESRKGTLRGLVAITVLIVLDMLWFKIMDYSPIVSKKFNYFSAIFTYILLCSAIGVQLPNSVQEAMVYGALVGFVIYGVFNGTSYSINKDWTIKIAVLDTIWGATVMSTAATVVYYIFHKDKQY
tara:strand:- start:1995 stop:2402 length:408 start_codon:yes stop_codon:yes gene_type:complete